MIKSLARNIISYSKLPPIRLSPSDGQPGQSKAFYVRNSGKISVSEHVRERKSENSRLEILIVNNLIGGSLLYRWEFTVTNNKVSSHLNRFLRPDSREACARVTIPLPGRGGEENGR